MAALNHRSRQQRKVSLRVWAIDKGSRLIDPGNPHEGAARQCPETCLDGSLVHFMKSKWREDVVLAEQSAAVVTAAVHQNIADAALCAKFNMPRC